MLGCKKTRRTSRSFTKKEEIERDQNRETCLKSLYGWTDTIWNTEKLTLSLFRTCHRHEVRFELR
jgi:hypothetical protein